MTRSPGWSASGRAGRTSSTSGTGTSPRTSRSTAASISAAVAPAPAGWVDAHHAALPRRLGEEGLPGPAALERGQRGEVHARQCSLASAVGSTGPGSSATIGPWARRTTVRCASSAGRSTSGSRGAANGPDWDRYADEYQATHGEFLGDAGFVWGPEGLTEDEAGILGEVSRQGRARGRLRRGPVLALGARATAAAAVGLDLSFRQLQHSRRIDDETGVAVPSVLGTATALPFADDSFDVVFCSFGALQFVADIDDAVAETARVLRRGGRFAFSITHPTRWMFPDDPGRGGLIARRSRTGTARRTSRWTTRTGEVAYVEHHRTLGDWVALLAGHGFRITDLLEPEWPRGPRPDLGRLVADPRPAHPGHRALRRGLGAALTYLVRSTFVLLAGSATRPTALAALTQEHRTAHRAGTGDRPPIPTIGTTVSRMVSDCAGGLGLVDGFLDGVVGAESAGCRAPGCRPRGTAAGPGRS